MLRVAGNVRCRLGLATAFIGSGLVSSAAPALEPQQGEAAELENCNRRTCTMLLQKNPRGDDLTCNLAKTWAKEVIKRADRLLLRWKFGDARCSVALHVRRDEIIAALTKPQYQLEVAAHRAECLIEDGGQVHAIAATLSPKVLFAEGKAKKIWVNLLSVEGNETVKEFLWIAAKLEDATGLFHAAMIKAVNRYIYDQCPKKYPQASANPKS
jgi:hypothetical protein